MLRWALIFFLISIVSGILGFTGLAASSAAIAQTLFFVAIALFAVFLMLGLLTGKAIVGKL